ncbi:DUF6625 family protein [Parvularcula oceani]|uniref:DUF6625 family protein n=1 Tax=Parvularcula oceani TaxID=1247963 RepID=UPI0004E1B6FA|nr:DUF6625 family protein [Parvularcula oceani]
MAEDKAKALLILPYFGAFGPWFPLFLHAVGTQHTLDLLLIGDTEPAALPANARFVPTTLEALRSRAETTLGLPLALPEARKLCDLRPAYGRLFAEELRGYDYWAYGDEDVLYGDLDRHLRPLLAEGMDVVTPSETMTTGHLTVLRNREAVNGLALEDPAFAEALRDPALWAYDESSWNRPGAEGSFTASVKRAEAEGRLAVRWGWPHAKRGDIPWPGRSYRYEKGRLIDNEGHEITYYHWGRYKKAGHPFPSPQEAEAGFSFDRFGFWSADGASGRQPFGLVFDRHGLMIYGRDGFSEVALWRMKLWLRERLLGRRRHGR